MTSPLDAPTIDRAAAASKVKGPAIGLMIAVSLGAILAVVNLLQDAESQRTTFLEMYQKFGASAEQAGQMADIASGLGKFLAFAFLAVNALIFFGALQMLKLRSRGMAMTAAILSFVNIGSCCCLLSAPFGIWALVALGDANVKAVMAENAGPPRN